MNIQNIQIAQSVVGTVEERLNSRKANISAQSDASMPQINVSDSQDKTADRPKVSGEENLMKVVYPPFFPMGNTQDILSIEGVKQLTGENVKSASSVTVEEQKAMQQKKINNKAANADDGAVRHDNAQSTETLIKDKLPQVIHEAKPGVTLDLKV